MKTKQLKTKKRKPAGQPRELSVTTGSVSEFLVEFLVVCTHMAVVHRAHESTVNVIFNPTEDTHKRANIWASVGDARVIRVRDKAGTHVCDYAQRPVGVMESFGTLMLETEKDDSPNIHGEPRPPEQL